MNTPKDNKYIRATEQAKDGKYIVARDKAKASVAKDNTPCETNSLGGYCQLHHLPIEKCWENARLAAAQKDNTPDELDRILKNLVVDCIELSADGEYIDSTMREAKQKLRNYIAREIDEVAAKRAVKFADWLQVLGEPYVPTELQYKDWFDDIGRRIER